jgi:hypothetical protein
MKPLLTAAQRSAIKWLREHGGDACFDRNGIAFAQGETAPIQRSTWNALSESGLIQFYGGRRDGGQGYGRLRLIPEPAARESGQ